MTTTMLRDDRVECRNERNVSSDNELGRVVLNTPGFLTGVIGVRCERYVLVCACDVNDA